MLLLKLKQGSDSAAGYSVRFRVMAAGSGWDEPALIAVYRKGLNPEIQIELVCTNEGINLDQLDSASLEQRTKTVELNQPKTP